MQIMSEWNTTIGSEQSFLEKKNQYSLRMILRDQWKQVKMSSETTWSKLNGRTGEAAVTYALLTDWNNQSRSRKKDEWDFWCECCGEVDRKTLDVLKRLFSLIYNAVMSEG